MGAIRCGVDIAADPGSVFGRLTDFPNAADHVSAVDSVEMLTDGPVGVGTRFTETRTMFGTRASETMEVVAFEPGRSCTLTAESCGCVYETVLSVAPTGAGSRVELVTRATPRTLTAGIARVLTGPLVAGAMRKAMRADLDELKAGLERAGDAPQPA